MARASRSKSAKSPRSDGEEQRPTHDIWRGSIAFGLVEIPVALVSAERPGGLSLSFLDRRNFSPVGYRRYNKKTDAPVPWSEIVHGYEYSKGHFVALGKAELKRANPTLTQTISIEKFVDASEIEPIYFEKPYYLEPLKSASKSYTLLRSTLERTGKVGIARVVVRTREHVAAVGVRDKALVLYVMRYADEVRAPDALDNLGGTAARVSEQEVKMAERLVQDMTGKWDPREYHDDYESDLMKLIRGRIKSGDVHTLEKEPKSEPAHEGGGRILDLMPLLKRSVEAAHAGRGSHSAHARGTRQRSSVSRVPRRSRPHVRRSA